MVMEKIMDSLKEIERQKEIKILYACETGSRAWGFPSPDSDYDVRFIYRREKDWYLQLNERKDTIEIMIGDLDITGWDLRKSLVLLKKSNASLIERFQSPVLYYNEPGFKTSFVELIEQYYSPTAVFFHHYSLAAKFWEELKDKQTFRLKSYFYLLRSLLSCNWIVQDKTVLPMHIEGLMKYISDEDRQMVRDLITLKAGVGESYLHPKEPALHKLTSDLFEKIKDKGNSLGVNKEDYGHLNRFFITQLYGTDNR